MLKRRTWGAEMLGVGGRVRVGVGGGDRVRNGT